MLLPACSRKKNGSDLDRSVSPSGSVSAVASDICGTNARAEFVAPWKKTGALAPPPRFWVYCFCSLASVRPTSRLVHAFRKLRGLVWYHIVPKARSLVKVRRGRGGPAKISFGATDGPTGDYETDCDWLNTKMQYDTFGWGSFCVETHTSLSSITKPNL